MHRSNLKKDLILSTLDHEPQTNDVGLVITVPLFIGIVVLVIFLFS